MKLAPRDTPWSALTLQDFTTKTWATLPDAEKRRIAGFFAWANELPPATFGDLYLGHHRASDGAVVLRGVANSLARLDQTDIPADAKAKARAHLEAHQAQFAAQQKRSTDEATGLLIDSVDLPPFMRAADVASINEENRTAELVFSTGADVLRQGLFSGPWIERLSLDPKAVRLGRLNAGAPLLDGHQGQSVRDQLGSVVPGSAKVLNKTDARATVKFSRRPDAEAVFQDVRDGVVRNVSVGYRVHKFEEQAASANQPVIRTATDWEPYELSLVPMGADAGAHVRASDDVMRQPCIVLMRGDVLDVTKDDEDRMRRFRLAMARQ